MYHIVICDDDTLFIDHMKCLLLRAGLPSETCKFYSYLSASEFEADFPNFYRYPTSRCKWNGICQIFS